MICIDCRYIGPRPSGIGEMTQALVDHAPRLAPDLRFLFLKHTSSPPRLSEAENVEEIMIPFSANNPATMWLLPRIVDLSQSKLFHATFNMMPAGLTVPCVTTIHDLLWLTNPELCTKLAWRFGVGRYFQQGIRRALEQAAAIATVSHATRSDIADFAPSAASRSRVTPSGVSADFRPTPASAEMLRRLGLPAKRRYVLTVGQYAPYKNHEGALAAFEQAFGGRSDVDLVFVQRLRRGVRRLKVLVDKLGLAGRVHFLTNLTREELIMLYSSAAALLHPSLREGFGNPLVEAMACGCPVITSDRSAMPEVTGGAALLAHPHDIPGLASALRRVVDDPALAARLSSNGLGRARELSWHEFARANLAIYRHVLGR